MRIFWPFGEIQNEFDWPMCFYKCMQSLLKIIVDLVLEGYNLLLVIPTEAIARTEYIYIDI